ncbi:MAG: GntR family transcriptional regulator [Rhodospirillales bacterium]|nr:GntR family transcriptional regulator [Rhodospirillales bacterium]
MQVRPVQAARAEGEARAGIVPRSSATGRLESLEHFEGTLANRVYLSLRNAIVGLRYAPGEVLRKAEVCEALGVSRSPVSAAVARLAGDGLVDVHPQAGTYVSRISMAEIREGAFIREALELAAIEHVARSATDEQIGLLKRNLRIQRVMLDEDDRTGFYEHDAQMHELLLSFTGYRRLGRISESVRAQLDRARQLLLPAPGRLQEAYLEHEAVVRALEARDAARARDALRHHLGQLVTMLTTFATREPALFHSDP